MFRSTVAKSALAAVALTAAIAIPLVGSTAAFAADATLPPLAVTDYYSTQQDASFYIDAAGGLLANDSDGGNAGLAVHQISLSADGAILFASDGSFSFAPTPGFVGTVQFSYDDMASGMISNQADIVIEVTPAPAQPAVANPDNYTTPQDTQLVVDVATGLLANDTNAVNFFAHDNAVGQLEVQPGGDFTFTPPAGFVGTVTFNYSVQDVNSHVSNAAVVTIEVTPAVISIIPSIPVPGNPGGGTDGDLPTLALTGMEDVAAWLLAPALALLALGGFGIWFARRAGQVTWK